MKTEQIEFVRLMAAEFPHVPHREMTDLAQELMNLARALHRLDEAACHYGLTPRQEKRVERMEERLTEIGQQLGISIDHHGDPRGYSVYLHLPSGTYNSFGGREVGYGVPL